MNICPPSHRPGTLPRLSAGNEPALTKHGRPASDILGTSHQRHPGWPACPSVHLLPSRSSLGPCIGLTVGCCPSGCFSQTQGDGFRDFPARLFRGFGGDPYCLYSLSCFEMKGGAFESPKKEKRSHRRWRSRAIGKDAKGTLQVTFAWPPGDRKVKVPELVSLP